MRIDADQTAGRTRINKQVIRGAALLWLKDGVHLNVLIHWLIGAGGAPSHRRRELDGDARSCAGFCA